MCVQNLIPLKYTNKYLHLFYIFSMVLWSVFHHVLYSIYYSSMVSNKHVPLCQYYFTTKSGKIFTLPSMVLIQSSHHHLEAHLHECLSTRTQVVFNHNTFFPRKKSSLFTSSQKSDFQPSTTRSFNCSNQINLAP